MIIHHAEARSSSTNRPRFRATEMVRALHRVPDMHAITLLDYSTPVVGEDGTVYRVRACGVEREDHRWEGWLEFDTISQLAVRRTERETTQPNLSDVVYWATGVSPVYLEGALHRAS